MIGPCDLRKLSLYVTTEVGSKSHRLNFYFPSHAHNTKGHSKCVLFSFTLMNNLNISTVTVVTVDFACSITEGASVAEWLTRLAWKLLVPLRWGFESHER